MLVCSVRLLWLALVGSDGLPSPLGRDWHGLPHWGVWVFTSVWDGLATHNHTFYIFLAPQSGALSRRAFRDTIPIPVPIKGLSAEQNDMVIWNIPRQTKADHGRPAQTKAGTVRYRRVQKSVPKQCPQKGSQKTPYRFQDFSLTFSYKIHIHGKYQSKGCRCRWYPRCYCHLRCFIKSLNSAVGKWWDWTMSITRVKAVPGNQLWLDYSARFFSIYSWAIVLLK